jgi:hypothetical protein
VPVSAAASVARGVEDALGDGGLVLACGSLFLVGEAMAAVSTPDLEQL